MNENIEDNDWKKDAPRLAAMVRTIPFTVPNNYFEGVDATIQSAIFLDGLKQKSSENSFEVPQHYFEELTQRIETNTRLSELPKAENAFEVPEHYFDTLQNKIADKIAAEAPKKVAKIIPLWRRSIVKYASAACFLFMVSFGTYFYQNSESSIPVAQTKVADLANDQLLYDIDESTIIDHLEAENIASSPTNSASDTEMENYILSNFSSSDLSHELNN